MSASVHSSRFEPADEAEGASRVGGRYLLLEKLGTGGMGVVYRARDEFSGKTVALKQLISSLAGSKRRTVEALFEREYHTLQRLKHPRIIEVYDYGISETGPYYTMELLETGELARLLRSPYREVCRHLRDVASSLALIHAQRMIHRDVSPRNIRFTDDGRAKLIDFGALVPFGISDEVVGTPVCMAPEIVESKPLDQRTDLFALGAILYWLLTGRHAYPARRIADLFELWKTPPLPPSALVSEIPPALEALVLSLLSLDPLGRPPSAAAVIDQLTAVAELEPEEYEHAAASYLLSGRMVGRQPEMDAILPRIQRALEGRGGHMLLDGPTGIGKTRLLHEVSVQAQLRGAVTLRADAQANPEPYGVAVSLALALLGASPDLAQRAAEPHAPVLAHLAPELRERLGEVAPTALPRDLGRRRALFQTALREWFSSVVAERTLVLVVDNIQTVDDNSLAFLATLAREARNSPLFLIASKRAGDAVVAPAPLRLMQQHGTRLKLSALTAKHCEELVKSLFGDVANTGRLARLLFDKSAGVPQQCVDLARLLVRKKVVSYAGGTWVLPQDISPADLPSRSGEIIASRLTGLSPAASDLLEALSLDAKPVPIERCAALVPGRNEAEIYAALDELVAEQVLLSEAGSYRFAQESLRRAVLGRMEASHRRARHLRAAEALLAGAGTNSQARMDAALHLLDAGEETRSAQILSRVGWEFIGDTGAHVSADPIAKALHRVFAVYKQQGRSDHELAALLFPLMPLSYFSAHYSHLLEHGELALTIGFRITGLTLAQKLKPVLGRRIALLIGLVVGGIGFALKGGKRLGYSLKDAIVASCAIVPSVVGTFSTTLNADAVKRLASIVEPLALFGEGHIATLMHEFAAAQVLTTSGQEHEAVALLDHSRRCYKKPEVIAAIGEEHAKSMYGGVLFCRALTGCYTLSDEPLRIASEMETLGIPLWVMAADQVRLLYHAFRGESSEVERYRERVELFAVQGGTTWQAELFWPSMLMHADFLTGDTLGARHNWEQLARRGREVESVRLAAAGAQALFLLLRGDLGPAIANYEQRLKYYPIRDRAGWQSIRTYLATALNRHGDHGRARQVALEVISNMRSEDEEFVAHFLEAQRQLALAEAGLGNSDEGLRSLNALLAKHGSSDNPLFIGLLYKGCAEIALSMCDKAAFETHFAEMAARFRRTNNPALIAQCERLLSRAVQLGVADLPDPMPPGAMVEDRSVGSDQSMTALVHKIGAAFDELDAALKLVIRETRARNGFLYSHREGRLKLVATSSRSEAPSHLEQALAVQLQELVGPTDTQLAGLQTEQSMSAVRRVAPPVDQQAPLLTATEVDCFENLPSEDGAEDDLGSTMLLEPSELADARQAYQVTLLQAPRESTWLAVGGLIMEIDPDSFIQPSPNVLAALAQTMYDREHAVSAVSHILSG